MSNQQLINYINQCLAQGQTKEQVKQALLQAGWQEENINAAFDSGNINVNADVAIPVDYRQDSRQFVYDDANNQIKYAGFWIRLIAMLIDGLVISLVMGVLYFFGLIMLGNIYLILILPIIGGLFCSIYYIVMTYKFQATIGKKLANLVVISDKAENLTIGQVILREIIGKIISSIFFIGYFMVGFTKRKQGLHDKIAKTIVIYKDPSKKVSAWVIVLGIMIPIIIIAINIFFVFENIRQKHEIKNDLFNKVVNIENKQEKVCDNYECLISAAAQCQPISATISYSGAPFPLDHAIAVSGQTRYEIKKSSGINNCILIFSSPITNFSATDKGRKDALAQGMTDAQITALLQKMNDSVKKADKIQTICQSNASAISDYLIDAKNGNSKSEGTYSSGGNTTTYTTSSGEKLICNVVSSEMGQSSVSSTIIINQQVKKEQLKEQTIVGGPIATIEGYIFIDNNKNGIFDKNDSPFSDIYIMLAKMEINPDGSKKVISTAQIKPYKNGYYKFAITSQGNYEISPQLGNQIKSVMPSEASRDKGYFEIKGGESITKYNFYVEF